MAVAPFPIEIDARLYAYYHARRQFPPVTQRQERVLMAGDTETTTHAVNDIIRIAGIYKNLPYLFIDFLKYGAQHGHLVGQGTLLPK